MGVRGVSGGGRGERQMVKRKKREWRSEEEEHLSPKKCRHARFWS